MNSFELEENVKFYDFLIMKYSEKHRFYHNINHINDCLEKLDETGKGNRELELAIWYHDIIYDSYGKHNELKSAEEMKKLLSKYNIENRLIERIFNLITITKHDEIPRTEDEALIVDIDISILGRTAEEYQIYTASIRKEYKLIPFFYYKRKRKEIMTKFLKKERLYNTDYFYNLYEEQARKNIIDEISKL